MSKLEALVRFDGVKESFGVVVAELVKGVLPPLIPPLGVVPPLGVTGVVPPPGGGVEERWVADGVLLPVFPALGVFGVSLSKGEGVPA